jgi:hypothetical protein
MRAFLKFVVVFVFFGLAGCSTAPLLLSKNGEIQGRDQGIVFSTFSHTESGEKGDIFNKMTSIKLVIRRVDSKKIYTDLSTSDGMWVYGGWNEKTVTKVENKKSWLVSAASLPVGEYELVARDIYLSMYPMIYSQQLVLDFPIRFIVKSNEITYLGEHRLVHRTGVNMLGMQVPSRISMDIVDGLANDYVMLMNARPGWSALPVTDALR